MVDGHHVCQGSLEVRVEGEVEEDGQRQSLENTRVGLGEPEESRNCSIRLSKQAPV